VRPFIESNNCKIWVPTFKIKTALWWTKGRVKDKWWFPGYAFIYSDQELKTQLVWDLEQLGGVYFLKVNDAPYKLTKQEITEVYKKVEAYDGKILEEDFKPGDKVYIEGEILKNFKGEVVSVSGNKVTIATKFFNRITHTQVNKEDIRKL